MNILHVFLVISKHPFTIAPAKLLDVLKTMNSIIL